MLRVVVPPLAYVLPTDGSTALKSWQGILPEVLSSFLESNSMLLSFLMELLS